MNPDPLIHKPDREKMREILQVLEPLELADFDQTLGRLHFDAGDEPIGDPIVPSASACASPSIASWSAMSSATAPKKLPSRTAITMPAKPLACRRSTLMPCCTSMGRPELHRSSNRGLAETPIWRFQSRPSRNDSANTINLDQGANLEHPPQKT